MSCCPVCIGNFLLIGSKGRCVICPCEWPRNSLAQGREGERDAAPWSIVRRREKESSAGSVDQVYCPGPASSVSMGWESGWDVQRRGFVLARCKQRPYHFSENGPCLECVICSASKKAKPYFRGGGGDSNSVASEMTPSRVLPPLRQ